MIFYFTATGNSKFIAERIAAKTKDSLVDISECAKTNNFSFELKNDEALGFVVPVYAMGIPLIVTDFLKSSTISVTQNNYAFAVLNSGGTTGNAGKMIDKYVKLNAVFGIKTVDNYVPMSKVASEDKIKLQLDKAEEDTDEIIKYIMEKRNGGFNHFKGPLLGLTTALAHPIFMSSRKTTKFTANHNCNGCGLCEKICPRSVIKINDGKPTWKKTQCEICLACLHRCPKAAINYGKKTAENGRYVNERVDF